MRIRALAAAAAVGSALVLAAGRVHAQNADDRAVRLCAATLPQTAPRAERAVACAEEFIARNGYTDQPPAADSTQWAAETLELYPRAQWPEHRHGMLERHALAVCRVSPFGGGYTVVFKTPPQYTLRAVEVGSDFRMRMEHREVNPMWLTSRQSHCRFLPRGNATAGDSAAATGGSPRPE